MFNRILVPLDGSRRAEMAIPAAAHLARASRGVVVLLRCVEPLTSLGPYSTAASGPPAAQTSRDRDTEMLSLQEITRGADLRDVDTLYHVVEGPAADTILNFSQGDKDDLIAVCAHGSSGYHRWKLGGVTQHVIRHALAPVLLLPDPAPGSAPTEVSDQLVGVRRALVPLDGSALAETAIALAIELLSALAPTNGEVHLLQVISPFTAKALETSEETLLAHAREYLESRVRALSAVHTEHLHLTFTAEAMMDADAAGRIVATTEPGYEAGSEATSPGYDVIVMATHGRTGVMRWTLGSIAERVIQATRKPMLIVRPVAAPSA